MKTLPELGLSAFVCPHCRAYTQQQWFILAAHKTEKTLGFDPKRLTELIQSEAGKEEADRKPDVLRLYKAVDRALKFELPALLSIESGSEWENCNYNVWNMHLSLCFVCEKEAVWLGQRILYPITAAEVDEVNPDIPSDIARDYDEAAALLVHSPRAAAALLRLAIQKLCSHILDRPGDINEMIGELVKQGLSVKIQRALDVVRVVGNEALHPGTMDIRDDQHTASQLFRLVNLIAEAMISTPKHVDEMFAALPPGKLKGIEDRDRPKKTRD
ncbi:DUF4145 domain-containing protein [uncultured Brevundimonas sp.]|uniref:DUF4145 domain-containing protein n=1 Tax=uncultured Brevundimonas sp. TaxID=213418 RepID=UPI0030EEB1D9|tara:strand:- start:61 stop:876 length:816 start_codon:yes stop_codon:yes gene_type:complete